MLNISDYTCTERSHSSAYPYVNWYLKRCALPNLHDFIIAQIDI